MAAYDQSNNSRSQRPKIKNKKPLNTARLNGRQRQETCNGMIDDSKLIKKERKQQQFEEEITF